MRILHFTIDEPKPLTEMTEEELKDHASNSVAAHEHMKAYVMSVYTELIKREHARHDAQRGPSGGVTYKSPSKPSASSKPLSEAQWRAMMMENDDES